MKYEDIIYEREDGVATISLNRPEKLNALTPRTCLEVTGALKEVSEDDEVKVLVFTGAGRAFCSGGDVVSWRELTPWAREQAGRSIRLEGLEAAGTMMRALRNLVKPTIAALNGFAAGAGFSLAISFDLRIASENARFYSAFVSRAVTPDTGLTYFLPRLIGAPKALELMWTGDIIDAKEAERIGLVNRVVPHDELIKTTKELATRIAKGPSVAIELTKRLVYSGLEANHYFLQLACEAWGMSTCWETEDVEEGARSFLEKRPPQFKGR